MGPGLGRIRPRSAAHRNVDYRGAIAELNPLADADRFKRGGERRRYALRSLWVSRGDCGKHGDCAGDDIDRQLSAGGFQRRYRHPQIHSFELRSFRLLHATHTCLDTALWAGAVTWHAPLLCGTGWDYLLPDQSGLRHRHNRSDSFLWNRALQQQPECIQQHGTDIDSPDSRSFGQHLFRLHGIRIESRRPGDRRRHRQGITRRRRYIGHRSFIDRGQYRQLHCFQLRSRAERYPDHGLRRDDLRRVRSLARDI